MSEMVTSSEVAAALIEAVNSRNLGRFTALLAPEAVYWNNVEQREADRGELLEHLTRDFAFFAEFAYVDVQCHPFEDGFALRMRGRATTVTGARIDFPICIIGLMEDGKLVRLEDWVNPSHLLPLMQTGTPA